jgi:hypothetical protein
VLVADNRKGLTTMRFTLRNLITAFALVTFTSLHAQQEAARIETQDIYNRELPSLEQQPAAAVSDEELGQISLVLRQPRPKMFTFSTNQSFNFTDNAFLVFFWNGRLDASFVPYATRDFTPRLTLEQNWFRYDHFSTLNFDSQSALLDLKYDLTPDDRWFIDGSYSYSRLYSQYDSTGEFYKFGLLNFSGTHVMGLSGLPIFIALTAGSYWRQGDPSIYDRIAPYLSAVGIYSFTRELQLTAFVRPEFQIYTNDPDKAGRKDFNLTVGSTLSWTPVQYVTVGATASYIGNFSNAGARGYNVVSPAVILAASIAF